MSVKVTTKDTGGQKLNKKIRVLTNDPDNPELELSFACRVEAFAYIMPRKVRLSGLVGQPVRSAVRIIPRPERLFKITDARLRTGEHLEFKMDEIEENGTRQYLVSLENIKADPGYYHDTVILKTDHPDKPEIMVRVLGNIRKPEAEPPLAGPVKTGGVQ